MNLSELNTTKAAEDGAWLTLKDPRTGTPLGEKGKDGALMNVVRIKLAGSDSERFKSYQRKAQNRRLADASKRGRVRLTAEEIELEGIGLLAAVTMAWENVEVDGKPVICTEEAARDLYQAFPWIKEQADEFVGDRDNFFTK